jgi:hypothetical protein
VDERRIKLPQETTTDEAHGLYRAADGTELPAYWSLGYPETPENQSLACLFARMILDMGISEMAVFFS